MDSNYHIFKKTIKTNKKATHKWYYFWNDPFTGKMYQRVCKGCKTQEEKITIAKIAEWMYVPGGPHLERLEHSETKYQNFPQFDEGHKAMYLLSLCCVKLGLRT